MATEEALKNITVPANSDLSASQYCFMNINSSGNLVLPTFSGIAKGVLQNKPAASGRSGTLAVGGRTKVVCGGTVNPGDEVSCDLQGRAVTVTTDTNVLGVCLEGGTVGTIGSIILDLRR